MNLHKLPYLSLFSADARSATLPP